MRKTRELWFSSLINGKEKCKFTGSCRLYSTASYTCTHTGGSYCGKYRKLSRTPENKKVQTPFLIQNLLQN